MRIWLTILVIAVQGCKIIDFTSNGWGRLPETKRTLFVKEKRVNVGDSSIPLYNANHIDSVLTKNKKVWFHFWVPGCTVLNLKDSIFVAALENKVEIIIIPTEFNMELLEEVYTKEVENGSIKFAFLNPETFGYRSDQNQRRFNKLVNNNSSFSQRRYSEYYFKDAELVYAHGWRISGDIFN